MPLWGQIAFLDVKYEVKICDMRFKRYILHHCRRVLLLGIDEKATIYYTSERNRQITACFKLHFARKHFNRHNPDTGMMNVRMASLVGVLVLLAIPQAAVGFSPAIGRAHLVAPSSSARAGRGPATGYVDVRLHASNKDEDADDDAMANAFKALDGLSADDFADDDAALTSGMKRSSGDDGSDEAISFDGAPEEEIKKYKEMMTELESEGDGGIYDAIREELGGGSAGGAPYKTIEEAVEKETSILDDADGLGSSDDEEAADIDVSISEKDVSKAPPLTADDVVREATGQPQKPDMEKFMEAAVSEALREAREQSPDVNPQSIRDDEELMAEINAIFEKANDKLMDSVKEMKAEQDSYVKKESEGREDMFKENEARLKDAEQSVSRLMNTVSKETSEVERALADLERERSKLDSSPLAKIAGLKEGGIVKQMSFVGLVLFSLRTVTEILQIAGPNGESHATAAAIQGVIALACGAYFALF